MDGIVYMYVSPSNKKYIGQTTDEARRISDHKKMRGHKNIFHSAIAKYGFNNFLYVVLHRGIETQEELDMLESNEIVKYNSLYPSGYNLISGGRIGKKFSSVSKAKMSVSQKKRPPASQETRNKISAALSGRPKSREHIEKIVLKTKGKKRTQEQIEKIKKSHAKFHVPVFCVETGKTYKSIIDASRECGISRGCISLALNGNRISAGGYHWVSPGRSEIDISAVLNKKSRNDAIRMRVVCVETGVSYQSCTAAQKATGAYSISRCCKNPGYTSGGFHWRYDNV